MRESMKALVKTREAPGLTLKEMDIPKSLRADEVLVRVKRASVCGTDIHIYSWDKWSQERIRTPQIVGHEFFGEVVEVGTNVSLVSVGDRVTAETHIPCKSCLQCRTGRMHICKNLKILGVDIDGVFAEYVRVPEIVLWKLDGSIREDFASVMEPLGNAVYACSVVDLKGMNVLITGAGPIGAFSVALSKLFGAARVIVTEPHRVRRDLAKRMGADVVLNPADDNVNAVVQDLTDGNGADVLIEMSGSEAALIQGLSCLTSGGEASILGVYPTKVSLDFNSLLTFKGISLFTITGRRMFETWQSTASLLRNDRIDISPVITHVFPFSGWEDAIRTILSGESGKVILDLERGDS